MLHQQQQQQFPTDSPSMGRQASPPSTKRLRAGQGLPPLHTITAQLSTRPPSPPSLPTSTMAMQDDRDRAAIKLEQLKRTYRADVVLVHRELRRALAVCSRSEHAAELADVVRRLDRSVETLRRLLRVLATPAERLRGLHLAQVRAVEAQIATHVLPVATVIRSFERSPRTASRDRDEASNSDDQDDDDQEDDKMLSMVSPRSPSGVLPGQAGDCERDRWHYLSMALALQL